MNRLRKMKGFTLIELIVVVIIIGVLAAVAAVAYNKFVGDARTGALEADAKKVADAWTAQTAADGEVTELTDAVVEDELGVDLADNITINTAGDPIVFTMQGADDVCISKPTLEVPSKVVPCTSTP